MQVFRVEHWCSAWNIAVLERIARLGHVPNAVLSQARRRLALRVVDAEARQGPASCRAGCTRCCQQLVPMTPVELEALANAVQRWPSDQRQQIAKAAARQAEHFAFLGLVDLLEDAPPGELGTVAAAWAEQRVDCPLLIDGLCSVYEDRPLACRAQLVTSEPAECDRDHGRVVPLQLDGPGVVRELADETHEAITFLPLAMGEILGRPVERAVG